MVVLDTPRRCSPALARNRTLSRSAHFHTQSFVRLVDRTLPTRNTHTHNNPTHAPHSHTQQALSIRSIWPRTRGDSHPRKQERAMRRSNDHPSDGRNTQRAQRVWIEPKRVEREKKVPSGRGGLRFKYPTSELCLNSTTAASSDHSFDQLADQPWPSVFGSNRRSHSCL